MKLDEIYHTVLENLQNCTQEDKRLAIDALDIKVYATHDQVRIDGVVPLALPTIEQTSPSLLPRRYIAMCMVLAIDSL